jgi:hypothetical protein
VSNPLAKAVREYEELWPHVEKLVAALEATNLSNEVVVVSLKHGDAYITYNSEPIYLAIERGDRKYTFNLLDV